MKSPTKTIWKTVVFAGAMLAFPACGGGSSNSASTTPDNTGGTTEEVAPDDGTGGETPADPCAGTGEDPCAGVDPCAGGEDPCEGGVGRGFVLS